MRTLPTEDDVADMYDVAVDQLASAGIRRYEVSNFAKTADDESKHNWNYWQGK